MLLTQYLLCRSKHENALITSAYIELLSSAIGKGICTVKCRIYMNNISVDLIIEFYDEHNMHGLSLLKYIF